MSHHNGLEIPLTTEHLWVMPNSRRGLRVEVADTGGMWILTGTVWTVIKTGSLEPDEVAWLAGVMPEIAAKSAEYAQSQIGSIA